MIEILAVFEFFLNNLGYGIVLFLNASIWAGNLLVKVCLWLALAAHHGLTELAAFAVIFCNDYTYFVTDLLELITAITNQVQFIKENILEILYILLRPLNHIITLINYFLLVFDSVHWISLCILRQLGVLLTIVNGGLSFLGSVVIAIFVKIPCLAANNLINLPATLHKALRLLGTSFRELKKSIGDKLLEVAASISLSTYIGSLTFIILGYILITNYREILAIGRFAFELILDSVASYILQFWNGNIFNNRGRERMRRADAIAMPAPSPHSAPASFSSMQDNSCIICLSEAKNVLYLPCRHVACCLSCSDKLGSALCPMCRKRVRKTMIVYV